MVVIAMLIASPAAAQFRYEGPGELASGSGRGRVDHHVYAPDMRFPLESGPAYANSQVWGRGGYQGGGGSQCDAQNYSFPWRDNYCETRGWAMPMCPAGTGHQGQDIRPASCADRTHWVVAVVDGTITNVGSYSVYLTDDSGRRFDYLHMRDVAVRAGQRVRRGDRIGKVSNNMGSTPTTIHLHFNIRMGVSGYRGQMYVPPYLSLVRAYESLSGEVAPEPPRGGCRSEILGRDVEAGACVQAQRDRAVCGVAGCAWFRCESGAWQCADVSTCGMRHPNAACETAPQPAGARSCHSSTLGSTVAHNTCVQVRPGRVDCGQSGCAWFRCDDGTWRCTEQTACESEAHPYAECSGGETPPPSGNGWLRSPLGGAERVTSHVVHQSGGRNVNFACDATTRSSHKGTDFGVPIGTAVYASAAGTVIRSVDGCGNNGYLGNRCGGGYGNHVIVAHGNGHSTLYAHLSPRSGLPAVGTRVGCGDRLGSSGHSGNSTGPHLHFEVRRATDVGGYFAAGATDPYGGRCSSQAHHLWISGRPSAMCTEATTPRDDATFVSATHEGTVRVEPGARVEQTIEMRNTGSTTWTPADYVFAHSGGAFAEVAELTLPMRVAPGERVRFSLAVTAPSAPGEHRGSWRMKRRDASHFGQEGRLTIEIPRAAGSCQSATLGRDVESGSCVQVSYAGCGMSQCAWYRCTDGAWNCTEQSACTGESHANAVCAPPVDCSTITDCGACAAAEGCSYCQDTGACVADSDRSCTVRVDDATECSMCKPEGTACNVDGECCGAEGSSRCYLGFCTDLSMCEMPGGDCTTGEECCGALFCSRATFSTGLEGDTECCLRNEDRCESSDECCGEMQCNDGRCVCQDVGEPCADHIDCCGAAYCEDGVCTTG
jgi:murein DD-endopeptidase MepM/ murein hydrolase activator NlpD